MLELPAMDRCTGNRPLIAWALYFSVLFNVLCCGLGHGQALGFALNGIGGGFCSLANDISTSQAQQHGTSSTADWSNLFACPTCTANFLTLVFLLGVAWLLSCANPRRFCSEVRSQAPPRYCWPTANPRASPF